MNVSRSFLQLPSFPVLFHHDCALMVYTWQQADPVIVDNMARQSSFGHIIR